MIMIVIKIMMINRIVDTIHRGSNADDNNAKSNEIGTTSNKNSIDSDN